jgi:hypothetical protein
VSDLCDVSGLLAGADAVLDGLRRREGELVAALGTVRDQIAAGSAVLDAVQRWREVAGLETSPRPLVPSSPAPSLVSSVRPSPTGMSRAEQILMLLGQDPARAWRAVDVAEALGSASVEGMRSSLTRLAEAGRIGRGPAGRYAAVVATGAR